MRERDEDICRVLPPYLRCQKTTPLKNARNAGLRGLRVYNTRADVFHCMLCAGAHLSAKRCGSLFLRRQLLFPRSNVPRSITIFNRAIYNCRCAKGTGGHIISICGALPDGRFTQIRIKKNVFSVWASQYRANPDRRAPAHVSAPRLLQCWLQAECCVRRKDAAA